jgi:energy-coupling factor transporter ATP-binding protein EcfA2
VTVQRRVLTLARPRALWANDLARMSTTGALPIDVITCVSVAELEARLSESGGWSAIVVDGGAVGIDRDLLDRARVNGCAPIVVDGDARRPWLSLGAVAVLDEPVQRHELLGALDRLAPSVDDDQPDMHDDTERHTGRLVAVIGSGGQGTSTMAAALAQASAKTRPGTVILVDGARRASQAMLHGTGDVVPGLPELAESCRRHGADGELVRPLVFSIIERGYDLLLGLRRPNEWTMIRPRALEASIGALRQAYEVIVVDVELELDGERHTGSVEIEERHLLARTFVHAADLVLAVGRGDLVGLHRLAQTIGELVDSDVEPTRIVPVINAAPVSAAKRRELGRTLAELCRPTVGRTSDLRAPLFINWRTDVERSHHLGTQLPRQIVKPFGDVAQFAMSTRRVQHNDTPVAIVPGSLSSEMESVL